MTNCTCAPPATKFCNPRGSYRTRKILARSRYAIKRLKRALNKRPFMIDPLTGSVGKRKTVPVVLAQSSAFIDSVKRMRQESQAAASSSSSMPM